MLLAGTLKSFLLSLRIVIKLIEDGEPRWMRFEQYILISLLRLAETLLYPHSS